MALHVVSSLPKSPDVEVTFTGLLLMRFDNDGKGFRAGVVRTKFHQLRVTIELRNANKKLIEKWEHSGPLADDLWIDVQNPVESGLSAYRHGTSLNRVKTPPAQKKDFRWIMDLQLFHEKKLEVNAEALNRGIYLNNGIFFADKLFKAKSPLSLSRKKEFHLSAGAAEAGIVVDPAEPKALTLQTLAEIVGVNIYLMPDGGKVQLRWGNQSNLFPDLPKPKAGEQYKIIVNNDCCFGEDPPRFNRISDLPMYYEVITNVPEEEIPDLFSPNVISPEIPCMPVLE